MRKEDYMFAMYFVPLAVLIAKGIITREESEVIMSEVYELNQMPNIDEMQKCFDKIIERVGE